LATEKAGVIKAESADGSIPENQYNYLRINGKLNESFAVELLFRKASPDQLYPEPESVR